MWFLLGIGVLLLIWSLWPTRQSDLPILLLVRDRAEEIEGVLRRVSAAGCEVHVLVRDSDEESLRIVRAFARQSDGVSASAGGIDEALDEAGFAAALVIRLDDGRSVRTVLQDVGF
jgi:hypothetical protein